MTENITELERTTASPTDQRASGDDREAWRAFARQLNAATPAVDPIRLASLVRQRMAQRRRRRIAWTASFSAAALVLVAIGLSVLKPRASRELESSNTRKVVATAPMEKPESIFQRPKQQSGAQSQAIVSASGWEDDFDIEMTLLEWRLAEFRASLARKTDPSDLVRRALDHLERDLAQSTL